VAVEELNAYLLRYSGQHERKGMGRTYVAVEEGRTQVLGYYTISSSAVSFEAVPANLFRHPVPVALIGRLAVDISARDHGLYAVVVDALDEKAKRFYLKYGFKELADDRLHLYLPMKAIKQLDLFKLTQDENATE
jgi:hypothetical protein